MAIEIIYNKWFLLGVAALVGLIVYKIIAIRNKGEKILEKEYLDIVNSEEYKVKGQYD